MKRLLYLAVLSMVVMIVSAPAALAQPQQGDGLCAGAQEVTSFSGSLNMDTEPFTINTETFQVAIDTTPTGDPENASTSIFVTEEETITGVSSTFLTGGDSEVLTVGNGPSTFSLSFLTNEQAYEATVFECDAAPEDPVAEDPAAEDPAAEDPMAEDPAAEDPVAEDPVAEDPVAEEPVAEEPVAEDPAAEEPVAGLPETGGPSVLLVGAALLLGSGILGLAVLRKRSA